MLTALEAFESAYRLLELAGFRVHHRSKISESVYFEHPARPNRVLRLSMHKTVLKFDEAMNMDAKATFTPKTFVPGNGYSQTHVHHVLQAAIGRYFLAPAFRRKPRRPVDLASYLSNQTLKSFNHKTKPETDP